MEYAPLYENLMMIGHNSGGLFLSNLRSSKGYFHLFFDPPYVDHPRTPNESDAPSGPYFVDFVGALAHRWFVGGAGVADIGEIVEK